MRSHVVKNSGQCSHFKRIVIRNGDVMLTTFGGGKRRWLPAWRVTTYPRRPSRLARSAPETSLGNFILPTAAVSTGAQPASTSSRTKCKRITFGAFPSSKWQFTASRTCLRRPSKVSASVKMDSPKARAVKPPSTASSIKKIISFMCPARKTCLESFRDSAIVGKNRLGSTRDLVTYHSSLPPLRRCNDSTFQPITWRWPMCAGVLNKPQINGETKLRAAVRGWNA
jgi:hypothetical protein